MLVSTKGRYALRMMLDLAAHSDGGYIPLKDIAARQEISLKYLERIAPLLSQNELVNSVHGKGGGYRLTRPPENYSVWEILRVTEGDLAPVACLECTAKPCQRATDCRTLPMWQRYYAMTEDFFAAIRLTDLLNT